MPSLPQPETGLVISYSYLWEADYRAGREESSKDRPCAVVIATRTEDGDIVVTVAAITHTQPRNGNDGLELPGDVKRRLGLDVGRSWLICTELKRFVWPGPDLRPISRRKPGEFAYGILPPAFMRTVFERLTRLRTERKPRVILRSP